MRYDWVMSKRIHDGIKPHANEWWKNAHGGLFRVDRIRGPRVVGYRTGANIPYVRDIVDVHDFLREFTFVRAFKK